MGGGGVTNTGQCYVDMWGQIRGSDGSPAGIPTDVPPLPPPCISYANVRNYYGPYAHCSLDKGVACAKHIQLPTRAHGMGAP